MAVHNGGSRLSDVVSIAGIAGEYCGVVVYTAVSG
jgi:hypothetical protein